VGKLAPGMEATFVVDAFPDERFKGTIRQIRNAPQTQQNVVTYDAVIDVKNPDLKLRPGMTANTTVVYSDQKDVLKVPNAALRFRPTPELLASLGRTSASPVRVAGRDGAGRDGPAGGGAAGRGGATGNGPGRTLWVVRNGRPTPTPVTIGVSDGTFTEIVSGSVQPNDAVLTGVESAPAGGARPTNPVGGPGRRPF
jgi:HlyD family secretion protein